ncbi:MAG: glycoside hydrolase family 2 TIM barrel-domain containing protein [Acidobacteriota bacterium]
MCLSAAYLAAGAASSAGEGAPADPPATEIRYLSGTGYGDEVRWDFKLDSRTGRRAGVWSRLPVPSQWQQEGFGSYEYGHDDRKAGDIGHYRHRFQVPESWAGRRIELVFDGVMTDTSVQIDGQQVGPVHQGGFYRFLYDVTGFVAAGAEHQLEVSVRQKSKSWSVEAAERDADYWVFGGIYRPVWLRALPAASIDHVAVDARHGGSLLARVRTVGAPESARVRAQVLAMDGGPVAELAAVPVESGEVLDADLGPDARSTEVRGTVDDVRSWSAETPHLYRLRLELIDGADVLHRHEETIGFRTVEWRTGADGDRGFFVNGRRVLLRGVNRHAFWPASGRTVNRALDRRDVRLMKEMQLNAVRASHYPPDVSFLEACDEMGLYVIDELAGWHDAYGTRVGRRLVREMVERDVNHPSIVLWANGNEDGWNAKLDKEFARYDPQGRLVMHPRGLLEPIDSAHYPTWQEWVHGLDLDDPRRREGKDPDGELHIATEALHGLFDGGAGAGLEEFWGRLRSSPRGVGLFLWAFTDEAVERTDLGRALDTDGNHAPDGVLGPYREPSGSVVALQQVFSPVGLVDVDTLDSGGVELTLENRFDHLNFSDVELRSSWRRHDGGETRAGGAEPLPSASPGERVTLTFEPPAELPAETATLHVEGVARGWTVFERVFPLVPPRLGERDGLGDLRVEEGETTVTLLAGAETGLEISRDLSTVALLAEGRRISLGAPRVTEDAQCGLPGPESSKSGESQPPAEIELLVDAAGASALVSGAGCLERYIWTVRPNGRVELAWRVLGGPAAPLLGVVLEASPEVVASMEWIGEGPSRQWGNRLHGTWGRYSKRAADDPGLRWAHEPKFRGYHRAGLVSLGLDAGESVGDAASEGGELVLELDPDQLFFGLFAPRFPEDSKTAVAVVHSPDGLAFLHRLPPIGSKQNGAAELSPPAPTGDPVSYSGRVVFSLVDGAMDFPP